jgi:hypothetical protein
MIVFMIAIMIVDLLRRSPGRGSGQGETDVKFRSRFYILKKRAEDDIGGIAERKMHEDRNAVN